MSLATDRVPWWRRDLLGGLRRTRPQKPGSSMGPITRWNALILANTNARREAKAILFTELAEATRQGMPLEIALTHASQTAEEAYRGARSSGWSRGAESRHRLLDGLVTVVIFIFGQLAYFLYLLLAFRMVDVERISRLLARRLHALVSNGLSLSDAMRRSRLDYDEAEVRLVEAGEQWGTLPAALKRLGEFQITENRLTLQGSLVLYPLWLATILTTLLTFCIIVILPKFKDIYDQLGHELPSMTGWLISYTSFAVTGPIGIAITFLAAVIFTMALLRGVMNGNRMTKIILSLLTLILAWNILRPYTDDAGALTGPFYWVWLGFYFMINAIIRGDTAMHSSTHPSDGLYSWSVVLLVPLLVVLLPYLLGGIERLVLRWERFARPKMQYLPLVGRAMRAEVEARWLGALSLAIASGVTPPDALRSAGQISGGSLKGRSEDAARLVEGGEQIGRACVRAKVLRNATNHHLALLDNRPNYSQGLHAIADDAATMAFETTNRTGRVVEVLSILALGIVAGIFALAMYLPLFNIPNVIGREADEITRPYRQPDGNGGARM